MTLKQSIYEIVKTLPSGIFGDETINRISEDIWMLVESRERKAWEAYDINIEEAGIYCNQCGGPMGGEVKFNTFNDYLKSKEYKL